MAVVIITGTSSGIGLATAVAFGSAGHDVYATMRNPHRAPELASIAAQEKLPIKILPMDVDDDASVSKAVAEVLARGGRIDILVNNAGIIAYGPVEELPLSEFRRVMETNYFGALRCIQAVIPGMRERRSGHIINLTSVTGRVSVAPQAAYAASKWALEEKSDQIEEARTLPREVVARMRDAGVFRIAMPKIWGGPELSTIEISEVIEEVSQASASAGWCVMIGCDAGFLSAFLDDAVGRKLYPHLDMLTAGSITPCRADRVAGGYRISGQWPFGSGINHADVVMAACVVYENGAPIRDGGAPIVRCMMAPASSFEILDTWHTTGLRGTGSNDFRASDLFIPDEHSFSFTGPIKRDGALYRHRFNFFTKIPGVPLGMARAMIDQVSAAIQTKVELPSQRLYKKRRSGSDRDRGSRDDSRRSAGLCLFRIGTSLEAAQGE